jgi:hypothetical protein
MMQPSRNPPLSGTGERTIPPGRWRWRDGTAMPAIFLFPFLSLFLAPAAGAVWTSTAGSFQTNNPNATPRPNLLIINADDLGFSDMAAYGARFGTTSKIPTPCMNSLASQGMMFTQAHSGSAVCTPSRYRSNQFRAGYDQRGRKLDPCARRRIHSILCLRIRITAP